MAQDAGSGADEARAGGEAAVGPAIKEGEAEVLPSADSAAQRRKENKEDSLYGPAQVFNRDLSLLVLSVFGRLRAVDLEEKRRKREQRAQETGRPAREFRPLGLQVFEAFAASGIRSIRYAKELRDGPEGARLVVANELDERAVAQIRRNVEHNGLPEGRVQVTCEDAVGHLYARRARGVGGRGDDAYDVIDLDPGGTPSPFLDAAVQAVADGGLLCITSTDLPILNGNNPETCFARYGGTALKSGYVHEMALRLVLHAVASTAAKYGREARPVLSCSIDFYIRLFVRVFDSPARAKYHASKTAVVHQCVQCESFFVQPLGEAAAPSEDVKESQKFRTARVVAPGGDCPECGGRLKLGGPFYSGPLHDSDFVKLCSQACEGSECAKLPGVTSWKKISALLGAVSEEHSDLVLFYKLPQLCRGLKLAPVPLRQFRGTLKKMGYRVSPFHRESEAVKTDAPNAVVYDLLRIWAEEHPPKSSPLPELLKKELTLKRPFEWHSEEEVPKTKAAKLSSSSSEPKPPAPRGAAVAAEGGADSTVAGGPATAVEGVAAAAAEGGVAAAAAGGGAATGGEVGPAATAPSAADAAGREWSTTAATNGAPANAVAAG